MNAASVNYQPDITPDYPFNCQIQTDGVYAGNGRFCKSLGEAYEIAHEQFGIEDADIRLVSKDLAVPMNELTPETYTDVIFRFSDINKSLDGLGPLSLVAEQAVSATIADFSFDEQSWQLRDMSEFADDEAYDLDLIIVEDRKDRLTFHFCRPSANLDDGGVMVCANHFTDSSATTFAGVGGYGAADAYLEDLSSVLGLDGDCAGRAIFASASARVNAVEMCREYWDQVLSASPSIELDDKVMQSAPQERAAAARDIAASVESCDTPAQHHHQGR